MDQRDEFSKWVATIESALTEKTTIVDEELLEQGACGGCGAWDCPECFPDTDGALAGATQIPAMLIIGQQPSGMQSGGQQTPQTPPEQDGIGMAGVHPVGDDTYDHSEDDEIDISMLGPNAFDEELDDEVESAPAKQSLPKSAKGGVTLGHIVQKFVKSGGSADTPTVDLGELDEESPDNEAPSGDSPLDARDFNNQMSQVDPEEAMEMISKILYMQELGLSNSNEQYTEDMLAGLTADDLRSVFSDITGSAPAAAPQEGPEVDEATGPKPTKLKPEQNLEFDDILGGGDSHPLANYDNNDGEFNDTIPDRPTPAMPRASASSTKSKTQNMTPSDMMRDFMGRISPNAGGDEPELPEPVHQDNQVAVVDAQQVPAIISNAMRVAGVETPEWHGVNNLPGFARQNIRGMGRQIFGMFTSTPLENITTIANVDGQGPNTDAELRSVAAWLRNNADDLGDVQLDHGRAIPGYRPDVKEYRINGVRFHVVRDPMGQYIYAYPDADARTNNGRQGIEQEREPGMGRNIPRLNEGVKLTMSLMETLNWDAMIKEAIADAEVDEASSLSKLLTNKNKVKGEKAISKGANRLISLMHDKHKLASDAILHSYPFSDRIFWKNFKEHPDHFQIIKCQNGVCAIKPSADDIERKTAAVKPGKPPYNPREDTHLRYNVVAYMNDGDKIDSQFLRNPTAKGDEGDLMKTRGGDISKQDTQYSIFDKLRTVMGQIQSLWVSRGYESEPGGAKPEELNTEPLDKSGALYTGDEKIHRPSINHTQGNARRDANSPRVDPVFGRRGSEDPNEEPKVHKENEALDAIFKKVRPVMKRMGNQALMMYKTKYKRDVANDAAIAVQKRSMEQIEVIENFLIAINTSKDVSSETSSGIRPFKDAVLKASGATSTYDGRYISYLNSVANGNFASLMPVMKAIQSNLGILDRTAGESGYQGAA